MAVGNDSLLFDDENFIEIEMLEFLQRQQIVKYASISNWEHK